MFWRIEADCVSAQRHFAYSGKSGMHFDTNERQRLVVFRAQSAPPFGIGTRFWTVFLALQSRVFSFSCKVGFSVFGSLVTKLKFFIEMHQPLKWVIQTRAHFRLLQFWPSIFFLFPLVLSCRGVDVAASH